MDKDQTRRDQQAKILELETLALKIISTRIQYEGYDAQPASFVTFPPKFPTPLSDLHPAVKEYFLLGRDLVESSLNPVFRKRLRFLLTELDHEYENLQRSKHAGREDFDERVGRFHDRVRGVKEHVTGRDQSDHEGETRRSLTQVIDHLNRFTENNEYFRPDKTHHESEAIRRIHRNAGSYQRNKITMKDLDSHSYKAIEKPVAKLTSEAIGGRKDAVTWSLLLSSIRQLQEVTSGILSNFSTSQFYLTPLERQSMETNTNHLSGLTAIFLESILRVLILDASYISVMERTSVLLVNSIYLLRQAVDAELFLWNPIPKYICNQRALRSSKGITRFTQIFNVDQIGSLAEITSTCLPSDEKVQKDFDRLFSLSQNFVSFALDDHERTTLNSGSLAAETYENVWHDVVSAMFLFIRDGLESLTPVTGGYLVGRAGVFNDRPKLQEAVKTLADEMREAADRIAGSERSRARERPGNCSRDYDVSEKWLERLESMRSLLLRNADRYSSLLAPSIPESGRSQSDEGLSVYAFDADCLLLLMAFCKAQVNKSEKFLTRKEFNPHEERLPNAKRSGIPLSSRIDRGPSDTCGADGVGSGADDDDDDGGDDDDTIDNELVDIIGRIMRECNEQQQSKEDRPSGSWLEEMDRKKKRIEEIVLFLSSHATDKRSGENLRFSLELVSSLLFQVDAYSRFNAIAGQRQFVSGANSGQIANLSRAAKGLLDDLKEVVKEGFQVDSEISEEEQRWLKQMLKWKDLLEFRESKVADSQAHSSRR